MDLSSIPYPYSAVVIRLTGSVVIDHNMVKYVTYPGIAIVTVINFVQCD